MSDLPPPVQPTGGNSSGGISTTKILLIVFGCLFVLGLLCAGVLAALLFPAVSAAREAAGRMHSQNNLKQIGIALLNYESVHKSLPPAYTTDAAGNKLHSWRTLILPYLGPEELQLSEQIDFSKPWNDPFHADFLERCPLVYRHLDDSAPVGNSNYVAVVDPRGIFSGQRGTELGDIADGMSNTLLVAEVSADASVPWMKPEDTDIGGFTDQILSGVHRDVTSIALVDGSVRELTPATSPEQVKGVVTIGGGEIITLE